MGRLAAVLGISPGRRLRRALPSGFARVLGWLLVGTSDSMAATQCPSVPVTVTSSDATLPQRICEAAENTLALVAECGLEQSEAIRIEVLDGIDPEHPNHAGTFHFAEASIELVTPPYVAKALGADHPFMEIPWSVFYDSLVAHEMAHALVYQTRGAPLDGTAESEYIAYAVQLWSIPEDVRSAFIAKHPITEPVTLESLNEVILAFSPAHFAARAWKHFEAPENGCRFIQSLLKGEARLPILFTP